MSEQSKIVTVSVEQKLDENGRELPGNESIKRIVEIVYNPVALAIHIKLNSIKIDDYNKVDYSKIPCYFDIIAERSLEMLNAAVSHISNYYPSSVNKFVTIFPSILIHMKEKAKFDKEFDKAKKISDILEFINIIHTIFRSHFECIKADSDRVDREILTNILIQEAENNSRYSEYLDPDVRKMYNRAYLVNKSEMTNGCYNRRLEYKTEYGTSEPQIYDIVTVIYGCKTYKELHDLGVHMRYPEKIESATVITDENKEIWKKVFTFGDDNKVSVDISNIVIKDFTKLEFFEHDIIIFEHMAYVYAMIITGEITPEKGSEEEKHICEFLVSFSYLYYKLLTSFDEVKNINDDFGKRFYPEFETEITENGKVYKFHDLPKGKKPKTVEIPEHIDNNKILKDEEKEAIKSDLIFKPYKHVNDRYAYIVYSITKIMRLYLLNSLETNISTDINKKIALIAPTCPHSDPNLPFYGYISVISENPILKMFSYAPRDINNVCYIRDVLCFTCNKQKYLNEVFSNIANEFIETKDFYNKGFINLIDTMTEKDMNKRFGLRGVPATTYTNLEIDKLFNVNKEKITEYLRNFMITYIYKSLKKSLKLEGIEKLFKDIEKVLNNCAMPGNDLERYLGYGICYTYTEYKYGIRRKVKTIYDKSYNLCCLLEDLKELYELDKTDPKEFNELISNPERYGTIEKCEGEKDVYHIVRQYKFIRVQDEDAEDKDFIVIPKYSHTINKFVETKPAIVENYKHYLEIVKNPSKYKKQKGKK